MFGGATRGFLPCKMLRLSMKKRCLYLLAILAACSAPSPEDSYRRIQASAERGDWAAVYRSLDRKAQSDLTIVTAITESNAVTNGHRP